MIIIFDNNNIMIIYFIILSILIILWLLFVYNQYIDIQIEFSRIKVYIFKIPITIKGKKLTKLIKKLVPTSELEFKEEIDMTSLFDYVHFDYVDIKLYKEIDEYIGMTLKMILIDRFLEVFKNFIYRKIDSLSYSTYLSSNTNFVIKIRLHFNIGILLLNYLIIKGKYHYGKQTSN